MRYRNIKALILYPSIVLIVAAINSCTQPKANRNSKYDAQFPFHDLKEFDLENLESTQIILPELDSSAIKYLLMEIPEISQQLKDLPPYFQQPSFYSIQHGYGFKSFVFLTSDESCCHYLYWVNYDLTGKAIASYPVTYTGGDGGDWRIDAYGKFLNDTVYQQTEIEEIGGEIDATDTIMNGKGRSCFTLKKDSALKTILFLSNGKISLQHEQHWQSADTIYTKR